MSYSIEELQLINIEVKIRRNNMRFILLFLVEMLTKVLIINEKSLLVVYILQMIAKIGFLSQYFTIYRYFLYVYRVNLLLIDKIGWRNNK